MILRRFQLNFDHNNQYLDCLGEEFLVSLSSRRLLSKEDWIQSKVFKSNLYQSLLRYMPDQSELITFIPAESENFT